MTKIQDKSAPIRRMSATRAVRSSICRSLFAIGLSTVLISSGHAREKVSSGLVLDGVTVVDTRQGKLSGPMAIVIDQGKIRKIVQAGTVDVTGNAVRVEATGKFVVPGYNDMHAHPMHQPFVAETLETMVSYGITGVRQMAGSTALLEARNKGELVPKDIVAPKILMMTGPVLTVMNAYSPEDAVAEIRRQKALGVDFIKAVNMLPDTYMAAIAEAKKQKLPFVGHLPDTIDAADAARAGMTAVEHMGPGDALVVSCSSDESNVRKEIMEDLPRPLRPAVPLSEDALAALLKKIIPNPIVGAMSEDFSRYQHLHNTFDEKKCRAAMTKLAGLKMWQVPSLIRLHTMYYGDDPAYVNEPNLKYVPVDDVKLWNETARKFTRAFGAEDRAAIDLFFQKIMRITKIMDEVGVPMMVGSDYGGGWLVPGYSLHQEFDLLAKAGLSPLRILQATTLDAARFVHGEKTMGTVDPGKNADLVVLDANPLESVENLHKIDAVVRDGTYLSKDELQAIRDKVAAKFAAEK